MSGSYNNCDKARYVWFKLTVHQCNKCDKAYKVCLVQTDSKVHQCNKCDKAYKVCLVHTDSKVHQCKCDKAYKVCLVHIDSKVPSV